MSQYVGMWVKVLFQHKKVIIIADKLPHYLNPNPTLRGSSPLHHPPLGLGFHPLIPNFCTPWNSTHCRLNTADATQPDMVATEMTSTGGFKMWDTYVGWIKGKARSENSRFGKKMKED